MTRDRGCAHPGFVQRFSATAALEQNLLDNHGAALGGGGNQGEAASYIV
jgi:hypothetical protein